MNHKKLILNELLELVNYIIKYNSKARVGLGQPVLSGWGLTLSYGFFTPKKPTFSDRS